MTAQTNQKHLSVLDIAYIGMFAALIAVCSWIAIPTAIPFTLQIFGVCCALSILGGRDGFFAVLVYVLLGAVGAPVFAEFSGGFAALTGMTGGYIMGFILMAGVYWLIELFFGQKLVVRIISLVIGLAVCYAFGTFWFQLVYGAANGYSLLAALSACVFPYLAFDAAKIALASGLSVTLRRFVRVH